MPMVWVFGLLSGCWVLCLCGMHLGLVVFNSVVLVYLICVYVLICWLV